MAWSWLYRESLSSVTRLGQAGLESRGFRGDSDLKIGVSGAGGVIVQLAQD